MDEQAHTQAHTFETSSTHSRVGSAADAGQLQKTTPGGEALAEQTGFGGAALEKSIPKISVVIPCYYSELTITKVVELTRAELVAAGYAYEFILVNDGSTDATFAAIEALVAADACVVGIDCAKNLGQHNAIIAGLHYTTGDYIVLMDDDMQTHPSQCMKLVHAIVHGTSDVVFARWEKHREAWWRRAGSAFSSWSMRVMTKRPKEIYSSNYLVMRRCIRDELIRYSGPYVYIQGLIFRATSNISNVDVEHFEREEGKSGYTFKTLVKLWSTILNFSMMPLRATTVVGTIIGLAGFVAGIVVVLRKIANPAIAAGWPSLMAVLLFCAGLILFSLGLIGEYLGRVFMTVNNMPQYVVRTELDRRNTKATVDNC